ncbi:winged helix-turn-helix transcriptional regulator [Massilimicrobiota sp. An142]|uniref:winged helix-turn-helix transcriptional regulator n=1 Tax=Massilimicrobiota sp. An142 TaxID=1965564 RepID=UPI0023B02919|nr:winged helix-turn-helix transcriptional regulator [Massilimicrobiota sp. An142]
MYVYKDRIEFINHNRPVPPLTTKDLNEKDYFADRQYANPPIKEMFFALNLIESYGSGIRRAKEALEKNKSPKMRFLPEDTDMDYTLVTVPINNEFLKIKSTEIKDIERIAKDLTVIESQILQIIKENPKISINKLSEKISKSPTTTKRYLRNLVENQIIERENGNKKGAWIFLKK